MENIYSCVCGIILFLFFFGVSLPHFQWQQSDLLSAEPRCVLHT